MSEFEDLSSNNLRDAVQFRDSRDGKSRILGVAVPEDFKPIITWVIDTWLPRLSDIASTKAGEQIKKLAEQASSGKYFEKAGKAGVMAEAATRVAFLAALPISNIISSQSDYHVAKNALLEEFAPVMDATHANGKNNSVIKNALNHEHERLVLDRRETISKWPTTAVQAYFAVNDHLNASSARMKNSSAAVHAATHADAGAAVAPAKSLEIFGVGKEGVMTATTLVTKAMGSQKSEIEKLDRRVTAWAMIKHMKQDIESQLTGVDRPDIDSIRISSLGGPTSREMTLKEYITEVFQQNERDSLGMKGHTNPLGPALVTRLNPLVDMIADNIADGRLDALAMVNLVGDNQIIKHTDGGARLFANEKQGKKIIEDLQAVMSSREVVNKEEFFTNFADPALVERTVEKNIKELEEPGRSYFVSLFPDDILKQAGMKQHDISEARKKAHDSLYDIVAANVVSLNEKKPEELKAMGLTNDEIAAVGDLAEKIKDGDTQAVQTAVDGRDKKVISAVRTADLTEQINQGESGQQLWAQRVRDISASRAAAATAKSESASSSHSADKSPATSHAASHSSASSAIAREEQRSGDGAVAQL